MRKLAVVFTSLALVLTTSLAGCSAGTNGANGNSGTKETAAESPKADAKPPSGKATKLTLWTFTEVHQKFYENMAGSWNKSHPDKQIQLEATTLPYEDMHSKLLVALQSGTGAPDISDIESSKFPNFLKGKVQLAELNGIVEPELNNIVKSRVDIYAKNGKYYGIDFHIGAAVIYYNKEILDKAGVNADNIKTWDDFETAGKTVLEKTGKPMITWEYGDKWNYWPLLSQQGADFIDKDGKVTLDTPEGVSTLTYMQKLLKEKVAIVTPGGDHHKEEYYGFMNKGGAASTVMPFWYMSRFLDYMPDLKGKIIVRPMPAWKEGGLRSAGMGGTGTAVTLQSKQQALAQEFLSYSKLSKEANIQIWKQLGFDPIRKDVWDDPVMQETNKFTTYFGNDIFATVKKVLNEINAVHYDEKTPAVADIVNKTILFKTINNLEDPAKVLKEAQAEFKK